VSVWPERALQRFSSSVTVFSRIKAIAALVGATRTTDSVRLIEKLISTVYGMFQPMVFILFCPNSCVEN